MNMVCEYGIIFGFCLCCNNIYIHSRMSPWRYFDPAISLGGCLFLREATREDNFFLMLDRTISAVCRSSMSVDQSCFFNLEGLVQSMVFV